MAPDIEPMKVIAPRAWRLMKCLAASTANKYVPSTLTPHSFWMRSYGYEIAS